VSHGRYVFLTLVCTIFMTLTGCVSTSATRLGVAAIRPAVDPETVVIYRTANQVPSAYDEIALVFAEGDHTFTKEERLYRLIRKKVVILGANALILDSIAEPQIDQRLSGEWWLEIGHTLYTNVVNPPNRKGKALAIYVRPRAERGEIKKIIWTHSTVEWVIFNVVVSLI